MSVPSGGGRGDAAEEDVEEEGGESPSPPPRPAPAATPTPPILLLENRSLFDPESSKLLEGLGAHRDGDGVATRNGGSCVFGGVEREQRKGKG